MGKINNNVTVNENGEYVINHKGKQLITKHYYEKLTDEECVTLKREYYKKPGMSVLNKQLAKVLNGGAMKNHIERFYLWDLMNKTQLYHSKWSVEEMWESNDLIRYFYARILTNEKLFPKTNTDIKNLEAVIRLGGKGVCAKPTNFKIKTVRQVLEKYTNKGDNYLDFSCGWGMRLLGSISIERNYFGIDPNYVLVDRLNMIAEHSRKIKPDLENLIINIRATGSENYISSFENKMDLAFTSIPYFDLEDYKIGEQSIKLNNTYDKWLKNYVTPTVENLKKYLKQNKILAININDYNKHTLIKDVCTIIENNGFKFIEKLSMKNIQRTNSNGGFNDNTEGIFIFKNIK